jgi:hypothetical protein
VRRGAKLVTVVRGAGAVAACAVPRRRSARAGGHPAVVGSAAVGTALGAATGATIGSAVVGAGLGAAIGAGAAL